MRPLAVVPQRAARASRRGARTPAPLHCRCSARTAHAAPRASAAGRARRAGARRGGARRRACATRAGRRSRLASGRAAAGPGAQGRGGIGAGSLSTALSSRLAEDAVVARAALADADEDAMRVCARRRAVPCAATPRAFRRCSPTSSTTRSATRPRGGRRRRRDRRCRPSRCSRWAVGPRHPRRPSGNGCPDRFHRGPSRGRRGGRRRRQRARACDCQARRRAHGATL